MTTMQKRLQKVLGCMWGATLAVACAAGEPVPAPAPPKAEMEVKDEAPHQFTPGNRRDPFTFIALQPGQIPNGGIVSTPTQGGKIGDEQLTKIKKDAEIAYNDAERLFMENDANAATTKCDAGIQLF